MPFNSSEYDAKAPSLFFMTCTIYYKRTFPLQSIPISYINASIISLAEIATDICVYALRAENQRKIIDAQIIRQEQIQVNTSPRASSCR